MGFLDALFGSLFDLDGDGKMSDFEKAAELGFLMEMMDEDDDNQEEEWI